MGVGIPHEAAAIPSTRASVAGPGLEWRAKSRWVFGRGFPGEVGARRPGFAHLPLGLCLLSPASSPFNFFFFFLSFNLISSNSTFVVNRRHTGISQSPPRNQLVKKARPALGKQAAGVAHPPAPSRRQWVAARGAWHPSLSAGTAAGQPPRRPRVLRQPAGRGWKGLGGDHDSPSHCSRLWLSVSASPPQGKVYQGAGSQKTV